MFHFRLSKHEDISKMDLVQNISKIGYVTLNWIEEF